MLADAVIKCVLFYEDAVIEEEKLPGAFFFPSSEWRKG